MPDMKRDHGRKVHNAGWGPQDAFNEAIAEHSGANGGFAVTGGDGGKGCKFNGTWSAPR